MKKIIIFILGFIPFVVNADCTYEDLARASAFANEVNYVTKYDYANNDYDITFYNVVDELYLSYNNNLYYGNNDNSVVIKNVAPGTTAKVVIKSNISDCNNELTNRYVKLSYYNEYYGSDICKGYDHITACGSEFLSYINSEQIVKSAIENYHGSITYEPEENIGGEDVTFIEKVTNFAEEWWLKVLLTVVSTVLTFILYNNYYRKVKHGI